MPVHRPINMCLLKVKKSESDVLKVNPPTKMTNKEIINFKKISQDFSSIVINNKKYTHS